MATASVPTQPARPFAQESIGFHPGWIPVAVALGIALTMLMTPGVWGWADRQTVDVSWIHGPIDWLHSRSTDGQGSLRDLSSTPGLKVRVYQVAIIAPLMLLAAMTVLGVTRGRGHDAARGALAFLAGLLTVPVLSFAVEITKLILAAVFWTIRISVDIGHSIRTFVIDHPVPFGVLAVAALLLLAVGLVASLLDDFSVTELLVGLAALAGGVGLFVVLVSWLSEIQWLVYGFAVIGDALGAVAGLLVAIVLGIGAVCAGIGLVVGLFGHLGRHLILQVRGALTSGKNPGALVDTMAGIGFSCSLLIAAAAIAPRVQGPFTRGWEGLPALSIVPAPTGLFAWMMSGDAEMVMRRVTGNGVGMMVDCTLIVITASLAVVSLLASRGYTSTETTAPLTRPVLIAAGLALALALPLLLLALWASFQDDS